MPHYKRMDFLYVTLLLISPLVRFKQSINAINFSQFLFALRTLRQHGLPAEALHAVFQSIVVNKLSYASPAWWGFTSADDRRRLEAPATLGYRADSTLTFNSICTKADQKLFPRITGNRHHLHPRLPPQRKQHYYLRDRSHNHQLIHAHPA